MPYANPGNYVRVSETIAKEIALYTQHNNRMSAPKYLLGESYGGFRAAKVASALKSSQGMLIWGIVLALVGFALLNGASWARWVSILLVSVNVFGQLGFLGNTNDQVWLLITLTFNIIILYALIVRWHESERELQAR